MTIPAAILSIPKAALAWKHCSPLVIPTEAEGSAVLRDFMDRFFNAGGT
jgi:hypothetical protein